MAKSNKSELFSLQSDINVLSGQISQKLGRMSEIASNILGYQVSADLCGDGEIEFRRVVNGYTDDYSCIRIEEIVK